VQIDKQELMERFLRYVAVETTANPDTTDYPSSAGQLELGKQLVAEMTEMGIEDAYQNDMGLVYGTVPATSTGKATICWNSHMDTSPDASGANIKPQVIDCYQGGDISLAGDAEQVIRVADSPELEQLHGATLITTDGTTLLGGDDKAGVAVIMQAAKTLLQHDEMPHGPIRLLFTCDEEIGRGVNHVDLQELAADVCYTLDGPAADTVDVETFSADLAVVRFRGVSIHPAIAKDRMVNAIRGVGHFLAQLPAELSPECTDDRDGFLHPYLVQGQVDQVELKVLLRDFDTTKLRDHEQVLHGAAALTTAALPGIQIDVEVTKQYRNLGDGLEREPRAVAFAETAHTRLGRTPTREIIRGGTDGSRLTELGLPTPNLSSGQHNLHSVLEWVCVDEMVQAVELLIELAQVWNDG
jgi:tripeptide aminopeptidase